MPGFSSVSSPQRRLQLLQLAVDGVIVRAGNRLGDLLAQVPAEAVAETVNGLPDGAEVIETAADLSGGWTPVGRSAITRTANAAGQPDTVTVTLPAGEEMRFVRVRVVGF